MKKLILFAASLILLSSCVKDSEEYKRLQAINDSLIVVKTEKDKEINNYFKTLNEISEEFDSIRVKEQIVATESSQDEVGKDAAQRIRENIAAINQALETSKKKVVMLQKDVKTKGYQYAELQKTIDRLTDALNEKALMLDSITMELAKKDQRIFELDTEVGRLDKESKDKTEIINQQQDELNAAYYIFGSKKELKAQTVLTKQGLFYATKVLQSDFNQNNFVKIDIRNTTTIPVYSSKAKIKTNHPIKSYTITTENGNKVIQIKDPTAFWSVSKYLVVETK